MSKARQTSDASRPIAVLGGMVFGAAWYFGAQSVLETTQLPLSAVPVVGALAFAAGLPALLLGRGQSVSDQDFVGLDALSDEVWVAHSGTWLVRYINRAASLRNGSRTDVPIWSIFPKDQHQALHAVMTQMDATSSNVIEVDGKSYLPSATPAGDGVHVMLLLRDVTEHLAEQKANEGFVSTVSHELRSPLTSIKGSMGLLLSNAAGDLPASARRLLEVAHRNAERLTIIINDILDLQKIAEGGMDIDMQEVDAAALVHEAVSASALFFQRFDLDIEVEGAEAPVMLLNDPNRIIQVLGNLLTNAAKFSKPGGVITVSITQKADATRISVRDEGTGIPADEHSKVFERFADLTNSDRHQNGGSGLGLSICKAIIDRLGGKIGFESVEGMGTEFHIDLPRGDGMHGAAPVRDRIKSAG